MTAATKTKIIFGVTAAAGLALGVLIKRIEGVAFADRSDTVLSASVDWESVTIRKYSNGPDAGFITDITVCGTALLASGEVSQTDHRCESVDLTLAQQATVGNVVTAALNRWKTKRGL